MLRYRHPEYLGAIDKLWRRYRRFETGMRMLREDMGVYQDYPELFDILYPRLRKSIKEDDFPLFGVTMSFVNRLNGHVAYTT